jgi:hypothetical protein
MNIFFRLRVLRSHTHTFASAWPWARCETEDCIRLRGI